MIVEEKVKNILTELSGETDIYNESTLEDDLALDSLSMVTMLVQIEDGFKIRLDESDMNPFDFQTVQNVVDMVAKYAGDENECSC